MEAFLGLVIVGLLAYIASSWATIGRLRERNAQLEAVLERRGGAWHEAPRQPITVPRLWEHGDEPTATMQSIAPPMRSADKTDPHVMVL